MNTKILEEGFTFDDVLLMPAYSKVMPKDVNLETRFSRNIKLNVPIASAAMDTVTESKLAIAIAYEGGIGVLHKNMSIKRQDDEAKKVKKERNRIVIDPVSLPPDATVKKAKKIIKENGIGCILIADKDNVLLGIVTSKDLARVDSEDQKLNDVMTTKVQTLSSIDLEIEEIQAAFNKHKKVENLPVIDENRKVLGLYTYKDIEKFLAYPHACTDANGQLRVAAAVGTDDDTMERIDVLVKAGVDAIVIDTAHAHSKKVIEVLKKAKKLYTNVDIVVGNIATAEAAEKLLKAGADGAKVGIGPGSICTTRIIAGIGVPQLTAIMNVAKALKGEIPIIADGGIRYSGDITKAIAAKADCIMAGSLFAGTEESPGETIIFQGRKYKIYRGMGSIEAMKDGSADRYNNEGFEPEKMVPEGIVSRIPLKGTLSEVAHQLMGGLRAGMGYTGSPDIATLKQAKFIKITNAGMIESHPHDVTITNEPPNYSK